VFTTRPAFDAGSAGGGAAFVLLGGLLSGLALFGVSRSQVRARAAAERSAADLRQSEAALRASEARYRDLFENANDIVFTLDLSENLTALNQAGEQVIGYTRAELLNRPVARLVSPEYLPLTQEMRDRKLAGELVTTYEVEVITKDGARLTLEVSTRLMYQGGQPVGLQGIARDVTERKQIEWEREQLLAREQAARAQAEEANRAKDEFLATVSHELRTPLTSILGWADLLLGGGLAPASAARAAEVIARNARSQARLIEDILDASRIITGKLRLNTCPVDLAAVVNAALDSVRPAAEAKGIRLRAAFAAGAMRSWATRTACNRSYGTCSPTPSSSRRVAGK